MAEPSKMKTLDFRQRRSGMTDNGCGKQRPYPRNAYCAQSH